jgi:hypothetical protein
LKALETSCGYSGWRKEHRAVGMPTRSIKAKRYLYRKEGESKRGPITSFWRDVVYGETLATSLLGENTDQKVQRSALYRKYK